MWGLFFFFFFLDLYFFIFRERGREGEREKEKHQCVVASHAPPTGDLAHNPGTCPDWELNQQSFSSQCFQKAPQPVWRLLVRCLEPLACSFSSAGHAVGGWGTGCLQGRLVLDGGPFLKSQRQSRENASPLGPLPKVLPAVLTPEELGAPHPPQPSRTGIGPKGHLLGAGRGGSHHTPATGAWTSP